MKQKYMIEIYTLEGKIMAKQMWRKLQCAKNHCSTFAPCCIKHDGKIVLKNGHYRELEKVIEFEKRD